MKEVSATTEVMVAGPSRARKSDSVEIGDLRFIDREKTSVLTTAARAPARELFNYPRERV